MRLATLICRLFWKLAFVVMFLAVLGFCLTMAVANVGSSLCYKDIENEKYESYQECMDDYKNSTGTAAAKTFERSTDPETAGLAPLFTCVCFALLVLYSTKTELWEVR